MKRSVFLGGLGMDDNGDVLDNLVRNDGVLTSFALNKDLPTGHCIALVNGDERNLCANLGAAEKYETSDLWTDKNPALLKNIQVIYVEGYFLSHSFDQIIEINLGAVLMIIKKRSNWRFAHFQKWHFKTIIFSFVIRIRLHQLEIVLKSQTLPPHQ